MTFEEVIGFCNHKYGEMAYIIEDTNREIIRVFTPKSVWQITKSDYSRFSEYTLYHRNIYKSNQFHKQCALRNLGFLAYYIYMHDYEILPYTFEHYCKFCDSWNNYQYGQQLWESVCKFDFFCD